MIGGFGMKKDLIRYSKPQECSVCHRIFLTPQDLISHFNSFHSNNHHFSTFSSSAAATPTTFRHYPNLNRNPIPIFPARNRFDLNYYRRGYIDSQGRFHKGFPPAMSPAKKSNFLFGQQNKKPRLMDFFSATSSKSGGGGRTLPLLCQLEHQKPKETVTENGGAISSSIDLTLRL